MSQWDPFWRIILPGTLPSIFTGAAVNHVGGRVADETISGGGTQGGGLRFFIWNSYMCGSLPQIVVGMISTGTAGYLSSTAIRMLGDRVMRWRQLF